MQNRVTPLLPARRNSGRVAAASVLLRHSRSSSNAYKRAARSARRRSSMCHLFRAAGGGAWRAGKTTGASYLNIAASSAACRRGGRCYIAKAMALAYQFIRRRAAINGTEKRRLSGVLYRLLGHASAPRSSDIAYGTPTPSPHIFISPPLPKHRYCCIQPLTTTHTHAPSSAGARRCAKHRGLAAAITVA